MGTRLSRSMRNIEHGSQGQLVMQGDLVETVVVVRELLSRDEQPPVYHRDEEALELVDVFKCYSSDLCHIQVRVVRVVVHF